MMPLIDLWPTSLFEASLKGSLILAAALATTRLMRRTSAEARHAVLAIGLSAFLFLPAATLVAPAWTLSIPELPFTLDVGLPAADPPPVADTHATAPVAIASVRAPVSASPAPRAVAASLAPPAPPVEPTPPIDWSRVLLLVWLAGSSLIGLRLLIGVARLWVLSRRSTMVTDASWLHAAHVTAHQLGLTRGVTLLRGEGAAAPMTWGVLRPVVWVPQSARAWPDDLRDAVLSHELAHVKRRDAVTQWLANIAVAVHWFNPLVWMSARALRIERERACDDTVLSLGAAAEEYAGQLLEMVRELGTMSNGPAPALAMARRSQLEGRLIAILDRAVDRGPIPSTRVLAVATFALVFVAVLAGAQVGGDGMLMAAEEPMAVEVIATSTESAHVEARAAVATTSGRAEVAVTDARRTPTARASTLRRAAPPVPRTPHGFVRSPAAVTSKNAAPITAGPGWENLRNWMVGPDKVSAPHVSEPISPKGAIMVPAVPPFASGRNAPNGDSSTTQRNRRGPVSSQRLLAKLQVSPQDTTLLLEIIAAADGITSSTERLKVLERVATMPPLDSNVVNALARAAGRTSGSTSRTSLIRTLIQKQPHARGASRRAVLDAIGKLSSSPQDQASLLTLFLTEGTVDDSALVDGLCAVERINSSTSKSQVLISTARARKFDADAVKQAYVRAAKTISSGDHRARALAALLGDPGAGTQ